MHIRVPVHVSHTDAMPAPTPLLNSHWGEHLANCGSMPSLMLADGRNNLSHTLHDFHYSRAVQCNHTCTAPLLPEQVTPAALTPMTLIADTPGSSPAQTADSALNKRGRSADVDEQSSPRRSKKPKPAGTNSTSCNLPCATSAP